VFVAQCLEARAAATTAPIVTPIFAQEVGALVVSSMIIESNGQRASIFSVACGGERHWPMSSLKLPGHGTYELVLVP
jgi:hypothetical protein